MKNEIKKLVRIAGKIAELAEAKVKKELYHLQKSGLVSKKEAKQTMKLAIKEATAEKERIKKFIIAELKRELKKAKPLIRKELEKKRKQFAKYRKTRRH
ncbi:MAG: hypothetical protein QXR48_03325 [Candidatus Woesearchaeota archaeon]